MPELVDAAAFVVLILLLHKPILWLARGLEKKVKDAISELDNEKEGGQNERRDKHN